MSCSAVNGEHSNEIVAALREVDGVTVHRVSDRTFLLHLGGKISVESKVPLKTRDDLSMAYTPGVGRVSLALAAHPEDVAKLTVKGNAVAVVTDGSAVLGLGNIGPGAALPVMEGKAALFKRFANIDAWPICLDTQDTEEIVRIVKGISPGFGGINLEDISAPRCFEIERRLRDALDIPVFHDDQHGTAIVVLAALTNALRCVAKALGDVRIVVAGGGAAGTAIVTLLLAAGVEHVLVWDREGILSPTDEALSPAKKSLAAMTNPAGVTGDLHDGAHGADVFIGVSRTGRAAGRSGSATWPSTRSCSRWPTPIPRPTSTPRSIWPPCSRPGAPTTRTRSTTCSRSRACSAGLLDARAREVTTPMLLSAAAALAACVTDEQLNATYIVPSVFDPAVPTAVAAAVSEAATGRASSAVEPEGRPASSFTAEPPAREEDLMSATRPLGRRGYRQHRAGHAGRCVHVVGRWVVRRRQRRARLTRVRTPRARRTRARCGRPRCGRQRAGRLSGRGRRRGGTSGERRPTADASGTFTSVELGGAKIRIAPMTVQVKRGATVADQANAAEAIVMGAGGEVDADDRSSGRYALATLVLGCRRSS